MPDNAMCRRENLPDTLRRHGISPTHQRVEIAHALFSREGHFSAEQVLGIVNSSGFSASKATVYNTLRLFLDKNLLREVIVDPQRVFYDPNTRPHHHFYNVDNGELTDIAAEQITIAGVPSLPEGTTTDGVDVIIRIRSGSPV
jgi:Fur family transcriptional regulator, iron response regulator